MHYAKQYRLGVLVALFGGCADANDQADPVGVTTEALSTAIDIDFEKQAVGPLGSPWTVTTSGSSATSSIVSTRDHGKALRIAHSVSQDYTFSALAVTPTAPALEFEFKVKPTNNASTFSVTLRGQKTGYHNPRFGVALVPGSNEIRVTSAATPGNGHCGTIPYGKWSTINWKLVPANSLRQMDVRVNGVMTTACTGVSTRLRSADLLQITDNQQASANAETFFDDIFLQSGQDGEI